MKQPPRVSVIMPFLNAGRFIREAIESVLAQTLSEWELILVNDGSSDESAAIAASFAERHGDRIFLLQHSGGENRGIGASRNLGMANARGAYLCMLDADDVYEPRRLERHVNCLDRDPALDVVLSADLYWYSWSGDRPHRTASRDRVLGPAATSGSRYEPPALIVSTLLTPGAPMPVPSSITFRAELFRRLGGIPETFRAHYEDQALICKLLLSCTSMVLSEPLVRYRQHPESVTQGNAPGGHAPGSPAAVARERFLDWLQGYARERGLVLPEFQAWLAAELDSLRRPEAAGERRRGNRTAWLSRILAAVERGLPADVLAPLLGLRDRLRAARLRRKVMRRIDDFRAAGR